MGLSEGDAERLQQTLAAVSDVTSGARWGALEQLRYFCEGAHPALLEAIAAKRFATLPALLRLLADVEACGGPLAVRSQPEEARVPTGSVLQLLESLLCNATNNLKPFLKNAEGVRLLLAIVSHQEELVHDVEQASLIPASDGLTLLDRASNVLCYCAFHHPELTASQLVANNGVAIVCRLLQLAYAHYMRTLARPGTALPSRPPPQADSIHRM
ncbi:MAG: hypothetical protein SGPRY_014738 [Prymnesium sp.]